MGSEAALSWFAMSCPGWTSNCTDVTILPFDRGPPEGLTSCASSLKCLPFDHGPDQSSTSCQADNPSLCQVTEACSFWISDSDFFFAFWMMDLPFVQMFCQMFDKIFARIRFLFVCFEKMRSRLQTESR